MMEMLGGALTGNGVCGALNEKERRKFSNGMLSIYIEVEKMVPNPSIAIIKHFEVF